MLADSDRIGDRRNRSNQRPVFALSREGQGRFDFSVLRKIFGAGQIESRARGVQPKLPLLHSLERPGNAVHVAEIKVGGIDQRAIAFFGADFKSTHGRFGESILHRASLVGVVALSAISLVRSYEQNTRADAFEADDVLLANLTSVQANIV